MDKKTFIETCVNLDKLRQDLDSICEVVGLDVWEGVAGHLYDSSINLIGIAMGQRDNDEFMECLYGAFFPAEGNEMSTEDWINFYDEWST